MERYGPRRPLLDPNSYKAWKVKPLPDKERGALLLDKYRWRIAGRATTRSEGSYGVGLFDVLAPVMALQSLWELCWEPRVDWAAEPQHLLLRINKLVAIHYAPKINGRRPRGQAPPTPRELKRRFGTDWQLVDRIWPHARFVPALCACTTREAANEYLREMMALARVLASVHVPLATADAETVKRKLANRLLKLEKEARRRDPDLGTNAVEELSGRYLLELIKSIQRNYEPLGHCRRILPYVTRAIGNHYRDLPFVFSIDLPTGSEENFGAGARQVESMPASTLRKKRKAAAERGEDMPLAKAHEEVKRGIALRKHHDPEGEWLTGNQCGEAVALHVSISKKTMHRVLGELQGHPRLVTRDRLHPQQPFVHRNSLPFLIEQVAKRLNRPLKQSAEDLDYAMTQDECVASFAEHYDGSPSEIRDTLKLRPSPEPVPPEQYAYYEDKIASKFAKRRPPK